ncbi:hypothetical protein [Brassicibacter mesophilus]|uniref:hypothetical protein n=1 Tax=Brassicibacter mesophilus TaxID=745119 RepID=UPI003D2082BC
MNLVAINGWVEKDRPYKGKYRNEEGLGLSGIYRRDYKKVSHILRLYNGNLNLRYSFPKVEIPFSTPMLNWDNIYFIDSNYSDKLVEAVLTARKPIGFIVVEKAEVDTYIKKIEDKGVEYLVKPHFWEGHCEIGIANKGKIRELFDIEALLESYDLMSKSYGYSLIDQEDKEELNILFNKELSDFLTDYDYVNPISDAMFVLNGLILGYPIESTVAVITGNVL